MDLKSKSQLLKFNFFLLNLKTNYLLTCFRLYVIQFDSSFSGVRMIADDAVTNSSLFATR